MLRKIKELMEAGKFRLPVVATPGSVYQPGNNPNSPGLHDDLIACTRTGFGDGYPERNAARAELIALALNNLEALVTALDTIEQELADHPDVNVGNSKVHYVYYQAKNAMALLREGGTS